MGIIYLISSLFICVFLSQEWIKIRKKLERSKFKNGHLSTTKSIIIAMSFLILCVVSILALYAFFLYNTIFSATDRSISKMYMYSFLIWFFLFCHILGEFFYFSFFAIWRSSKSISLLWKIIIRYYICFPMGIMAIFLIINGLPYYLINVLIFNKNKKI